MPPLAWLSGWDSVVGQFGQQIADSGAPQAAVAGAVDTLTAAQAEVMGLAGSSLGAGFQVVYLVAAIAATASAILTLFIRRGRHIDNPVTDVQLAEVTETETV